MEQGRNRKLFKDIIIYGVGNLGSKLITFLIFPVYTFFIAPDDLGYYDTVLATVFLLMPFVDLQLREGVFRFLIDEKDENNRRTIINKSYRMMITTTVITSMLFVLITFFVDLRCGFHILGLLLTLAFYEVQIQIVRGLGHTKLFVACGILSSLFICLFGILFVVVLKWGIEGIFLSNILARLSALYFIELKQPVMRKYFSFKITDKALAGELSRYCYPLIMVISFLWIIGNSYRYFISYHLGLYANGIIAVAFKFAAIIEILSVILYQAWQETTVLQFNAKDRDKYYSSVLNTFVLILTSLVITSSFILKTLYPKLIDAEYESSIIYLYALFVAEIGYALQMFMSAILHAQKNTRQMFYITLVSSAASLVFYYFFTRYLGLTGVAIAFGLSFSFMFVCYLISVQKTMTIKLSARTFILSALLLAGGGFIFYHTENVWWRILYWTASILAIYRILPRSIVRETKNRIAGKFSNLIGK
ncbi:MAG: oligosaccharide flippase family protein [Tannerella sp.]|jgi:O-antigen/teichoic acid export membrane protein|nr:oligosaccharide flippase family protein [Tannerella sp.]